MDWKRGEWRPLSPDKELARMYRTARLLHATMGDYGGAGGGVTSVAGKVGVVTLVEGDITNLVADLAAKNALLANNLQAAKVLTSETTTSTTYVDLTTPGPAVTLTVGPQGVAVVFLGMNGANGAGDGGAMSVALSGGNTVAASDANALVIAQITPTLQDDYAVVLTGLTVASTTFTAKYRAVVGGTLTAANRSIAVITY